MIELRPAASLSRERLAALFTAGYEDYYTQLHIDEAALGFMTRAWTSTSMHRGSPSATASRWDCACSGSAATRRGSAASASSSRNAAAASAHGSWRRSAEARSRGVRDVRLEVITENVRAIPLYERLGFRRTRGLELWLLPGAAGPVHETAVEDAHARVRELRRDREPWQRDDGTVANLDDLTGLAADAGAAVVRVSNGRVLMLQLAGDEPALHALFTSARALGDPVVMLNLPEGHLAGPVLEELGGRRDITQHEMALAL